MGFEFFFRIRKQKKSLAKMNENKIASLYTELKTTDPKFLFQFTRSSDKRIIKCKLHLDKEKHVSRSVVQLVEFNLDTKKENPNTFSDDILTEFFSFSLPIVSKTDPGVYETTCAALPDRVIKLHTHNNKFFMSTAISGEIDTAILGVHVTIDMPKVGPPLLRGITIFGRNKLKEKFCIENLSVAKYVKKFLGMMMDKQEKSMA
jgi:hypothetical protein